VKLTSLSEESTQAKKEKKKESSLSLDLCVCASLDKKAKTAFCFHNAPIDTVGIVVF
jgi:hypothetical protein